MTSMRLMPPGAPEWTVDDLARMPVDGLQYELLDGLLLVTPVPVPRHQLVSARLFTALQNACPDGFAVFFAPMDWQPDRRTSLQPDLLVIRTEDWSVDPEMPSVEALALVPGEYRTVGLATGPERVELTAPFPVSLVPADLVAAPRTRR